MSAYAGSSDEPQKWTCRLFGGRRRAEEAVRMAEEALKGTQRISDEIAERMDTMRAAVEQRLDRLSVDVARLNRPEPKQAWSVEEELGHLLLEIIKDGHTQIHLHKKLAEFVTEETARGASLAADEVLSASRDKPLKPGVLNTFKQLAEDPLHALDRQAKSGRPKADAGGA